MGILSNSVHVGLFVEDITLMVSFYRDIPGIETDWTEGPFASFKVKDGGLFMFDRKETMKYLETRPNRYEFVFTPKHRS